MNILGSYVFVFMGRRNWMSSEFLEDFGLYMYHS